MLLSVPLVATMLSASVDVSTLPNSTRAPSWFLVAPNPGALTFSTGIAFADQTKGYVAGGANGAGAEILQSTDGGKTFKNIEGIKFGLDLLLLAAEAAKNTVIVAGIGGEMYSLDDGKTWRHSIGGGISQSVRYIGAIGKGDGLHFGIAGQHGKSQGVALTNNGGITFKSYPASPVLNTDARYACYPDDKTWYLAGGNFPTAPPGPPPASGSSSKPRRYRKYDGQDANGYWNKSPWATKTTLAGAPQQDAADGYVAQIVKTVDGGATWTSVFQENGTFYFNEIDCAPSDPSHCCAVGDASGSSSSGGRIHCTTNGGQSWQRTYFAPNVPGKSAFNMMGIEFMTSKEAWACGGEQHPLSTKPLFLYTNDAGQTWTKATPNADLAGGICLGLDMIDATTGYAAIDNVLKQQAGVAKFSGDVPPPGPPSPPSPPPPSPSPPPPSPGPAPPSGGDYGDPNAGPCKAGSQAVQITGLSGSFCSPPCSSSLPCPTDLPDGATAKASCVLETAGSPTPSQCAMICKPGDILANQCPDKASCKGIQGTGLCTYDN